MNRMSYFSFSMVFVLFSYVLDERLSAASSSSSSSYHHLDLPHTQIYDMNQEEVRQKIITIILSACFFQEEVEQLIVDLQEESSEEDQATIRKFFTVFDPVKEKFKTLLNKKKEIKAHPFFAYSLIAVDPVFTFKKNQTRFIDEESMRFNGLDLLDKMHAYLSSFSSMVRIYVAYQNALEIVRENHDLAASITDNDIRLFKDILDQSNSALQKLEDTDFSADDKIKIIDELLHLFGPFFGRDFASSFAQDKENEPAARQGVIFSPTPVKKPLFDIILDSQFSDDIPSSALPSASSANDSYPELEISPFRDSPAKLSLFDPSFECASPEELKLLRLSSNSLPNSPEIKDLFELDAISALWEKWEEFQAKKIDEEVNRVNNCALL